LENEIASGDASDLKGFVVTQNWLVRRTAFSVDPISTRDIVWLYRQETTEFISTQSALTSFFGPLNARRYWTTFVPSQALVLISQDGREHEIKARRKDIDAAILEISRRCPWIFVGYSDYLRKEWSQNRIHLVESVIQDRGNFDSSNALHLSDEPRVWDRVRELYL
jgi:hypothetical protein